MKKDLLPAASPFPADKQQKVTELIEGLDTNQLYWLHGFLQGVLQSRGNGDASPQTDTAAELNGHGSPEAITILFGTHTGNCKKLAQQLSGLLKDHGIEAKLADMDSYKPQQIKNEALLLIIVSTDGEGVPPLAAENFYEFIHTKRAPELSKLRYSILSLGDKSYFNFCKTGADIDLRLEQLGAGRIHPRIDCDVDFSGNANQWMNDVVEILSKETRLNGSRVKTTLAARPSQAVREVTRESPVDCELAQLINLNGRGSTKSTYHAELLFEPGSINYKPGDTLGIWPRNDSTLVDRLIEQLGISQDNPVVLNNKTIGFRDFLTAKAEITSLTRDTVEKYKVHSSSKELHNLLSDSTELKKFLWGHDLLDLFTLFPSRLTAGEVVSLVRPLQPRLYSIASSTAMFPDEVHLTVALVQYLITKRFRKGAATSFISERLQEGSKIPVFIEEKEHFHLPDDADTDIIMIGPGTGLAPFRAFMQEREVNRAKGRNWLFFGDRNFSTDFLYQTEWQSWHKIGLLTHIDLAFSRDQREKVYVQHKLLARSEEVYKWLESGARIYVCGDRTNMAPEVQNALTAIVAKESGKSSEDAAAYIKNLRKQKRYLEDVY